MDTDGHGVNPAAKDAETAVLERSRKLLMNTDWG